MTGEFDTIFRAIMTGDFDSKTTKSLIILCIFHTNWFKETFRMKTRRSVIRKLILTLHVW